MNGFIKALVWQLECALDGAHFDNDWVREIVEIALEESGVRLTPVAAEAASVADSEGRVQAQTDREDKERNERL